MTFASSLLRILLCIALLAGAQAPVHAAMAVTASAAIAAADEAPCHDDGSAMASHSSVADGQVPDGDSTPADAGSCCDGSHPCDCVMPAAAIPAVPVARLHAAPAAQPPAVATAAHEAPPSGLPNRPPITTD